MLGFKNATIRNPGLAWNALRNLRLCMDKMPEYKLQRISQNQIIPHRLEARIFSDTILVYTMDDEEDDLTGMAINLTVGRKS